jgi:hypothetical protein
MRCSQLQWRGRQGATSLHTRRSTRCADTAGCGTQWGTLSGAHDTVVQQLSRPPHQQIPCKVVRSDSSHIGSSSQVVSQSAPVNVVSAARQTGCCIPPRKKEYQSSGTWLRAQLSGECHTVLSAPPPPARATPCNRSVSQQPPRQQQQQQQVQKGLSQATAGAAAVGEAVCVLGVAQVLLHMNSHGLCQVPP